MECVEQQRKGYILPFPFFVNALKNGMKLWNGLFTNRNLSHAGLLYNYSILFNSTIISNKNVSVLTRKKKTFGVNTLLPLLSDRNKTHLRIFTYRPFHKTLPRSSAFVNWILVRFYETDCIIIETYKCSKLLKPIQKSLKKFSNVNKFIISKIKMLY